MFGIWACFTYCLEFKLLKEWIYGLWHLNDPENKYLKDQDNSSALWLKSYVDDNSLALHDYNVYRVDREKKGCGVAIYLKNNFIKAAQSLNV